MAEAFRVIIHLVDDYHPKPRALIGATAAALKDTPVVLVHGARQTGKTTLARHIAETIHPARYVTLDDAVVLAGARQDPAGFIAALDGPVVLDEVQRAPELFLAIKAAVDRHRRPGRFLLTGSANVLLLPRLAESLVGRMEVIELWPFSQGELRGVRDRFVDAAFENGSLPEPRPTAESIPDVLLRGGYPSAVERADPQRRRAWFGSYVTTILERDVRDLASIDSLTFLPRLLALVAARTAGLLNFAELSRSVALPQTTVKRYLSLLEATFLVQLVPAWSANLSKRLIKAPKVFLNDTGLAGYLLGLNEERLAGDAAVRGALLENFVGMELRKQCGWSDAGPQLYHFRTAAGQEVDFVLEDRSGAIVGIEVKSAATVTNHDFNALRTLAELTGNRFRRGVVLYTGNATAPFGPKLQAMPISALWRIGAEMPRL